MPSLNYKAYKEGFRGIELYDELFKPTEEWYTSQMERRQNELKASESAKYIHHNLGDFWNISKGGLTPESVSLFYSKKVCQITFLIRTS